MEQIVITGGKRLSGEVEISGAKNAALAIIPASILANGPCVIENLPNIEDVYNYIDVLARLGAKCEFVDRHTLKVDSSKIKSHKATFSSLKEMRASYYLTGALLGRFKKAEVILPGGCNFGDRPIDLHIKGFEALGAEVKIEHGIVKAHADKLIGTNIYLDIASVGATINIMLAAAFAEGETIIENAAKEPHVVDAANFLNIMGGKVKGAGTNVIKIKGVRSMHGCEYTIIPDQIETGTYMMIAAATKGDITVKNIIPKHLEAVSAKLRETGCTVIEGADYIRVATDKPLKAVNIKTMYYPGFPTDLQPQATGLLTTSTGTSYITEAVFDNRFQYINEIKRLGANINVDGRVAVIEGVSKLTGAEVMATDLRAGASLIIAGLMAEGETAIGNVHYIDRGYEDIENKLRSLGANIHRRGFPSEEEQVI